MAFLGSSIKMYFKTLYISNMGKSKQNYYPVTHKRKYFFTRLEMVYGVGILEKVNLHKEYTCVVKEEAGHTFILHFSYEIMTCLKKSRIAYTSFLDTYSLHAHITHQMTLSETQNPE